MELLITSMHDMQYSGKYDTSLAPHIFKLAIKLTEPHKDKAIAFYKQTRTSDKKIKAIQTSIVKQLRLLYDQCLIIPSSSFTAKCNLASDSDIDIYVYYKKLVDVTPLVKLNYVKKQSPVVYELYGKTINGIPIEIKLRNYTEGTRIRLLHEYLDKKLTTLERVYITYIKHLLVKNKAAYKAFKYMVFNYCLYNIGEKTLI